MSEETRALTGPRSLTQMVPEYAGVFAGGEFKGYKGWLGSSSDPLLYYETYFDLTGYKLDDLTAMPIAAMVQDPGIYGTNATGVPLHVVDILSQERLDIGEVYNELVNRNNAPGMLDTVNNFEQITFGNHRLFLAQTIFTNPTGVNLYLPASEMQFGSGDPVTVQKLWAYRIVAAPGGTTGNAITIPASRFLLNIVVKKEADRVYLQRLKRSYELDQDD